MANEPVETATTELKNQEAASVRTIQRVFDWIWLNKSRLGIAIVAVVLVAVVVSGFYRVELEETAAKRRFGDLVDAQIQPGLHWRFPLGIEQVDKFPTARVQTLDIDVNVAPNMSAFTGDVNLIDARFKVQYRVNDLAEYLFRNGDPNLALRNSVLTAFVDVISNMFVYMVLSTEKKYIENQIHIHVADALEALKVGAELVSINMTFVSPPVDAIPAFRAVNDAKAERLEMINVALQRQTQTLAQARGEASHIVEQAVAQAGARIAEAESAATRFREMLVRDQVNSDQTRHTHYWNSVRKILNEARIIVLQPGNEPPKIAVNLLDTPSGIPGLRGQQAGEDGEHHMAKAGARGFDSTDPQHAGSAAAHVVEEFHDRKPGFGQHDVSTEAHHMGPIPDDGRRFPSHVIDPKVKAKVKSSPSDLGLSGNNPAESNASENHENNPSARLTGGRDGESQHQENQETSGHAESTESAQAPQIAAMDASADAQGRQQTTTPTTHATQY